MRENTAVLILTHGSRRNTFVEDMGEVTSYVERKLGIPVYLTHNEFTEPNWRTRLNELLSHGYDHFIFALAFLGRGNHVAHEIMGELNVSDFYRWSETTYNGKRIYAYITKPLADSELVKLAIFYRIKSAFKDVEEGHYIEDPEEIEENTMNMIREKLREIFSVFNDEELEVIARAVYASGNFELAKHVYISYDAIGSGLEALRSGISILTDVKMVKAGIRWEQVENYLDNSSELAKKMGITRTAAAMRLGLNSSKIVVIGNAPTALLEVLRIHEERKVDIPLVVASPPGFTNASEVKEQLIKSGIPCIVVRGSYGGSNIAVAIINELIRRVRI